jgi:hypothetical protein
MADREPVGVEVAGDADGDGTGIGDLLGDHDLVVGVDGDEPEVEEGVNVRAQQVSSYDLTCSGWYDLTCRCSAGSGCHVWAGLLPGMRFRRLRSR